MTKVFSRKTALVLSLSIAAASTMMSTPANAKCLKNCADTGLNVEQGAVRKGGNVEVGGGREEMKRGHNLVSGKVNKHRKNSILRKARAHNLVSGKVKKTKGNGTK